MKKEYISKDDYIIQNHNWKYGTLDKIRLQWYKEIILEPENSTENRMKLILENPEIAQSIFARYDDAEGFRLMVNNPRLNTETKRQAKIKLDSILDSKFEKDWESQEKRTREECPNFANTQDDRNREGHNLLQTDI